MAVSIFALHIIMSIAIVLIFLISLQCVHSFIVINDLLNLILKNNSDDLVYLNSIQLLNYFQYNSENHTVITSDGCKLSVFRIARKGPPVLLVHGIGDSSDEWLDLGPEYGLPYFLADNGYDVWILNSRGNKYSKGNIYNIADAQYWDFSYEELGSQDLPATIDYILKITSQMKLVYVGFSQGSTTFLVMCSLRPEYNDKIKHAVLLAPVANIAHIKIPFIKLVSKNLGLLTWLAKHANLREVFPSNPLQNAYHNIVCRDGAPGRILCDIEYYIQYGLFTRNLPNEKLPVVASHIPAGTSAKLFLHFIQGHSSKRFQRYDYGPKENLKRYMSRSPPVYDLSLVSAPVTLIVSQADWFTVEEDVRLLRSRLPNIVHDIVIPESINFSHLEFVYGSRAKSIVYVPILNLLSQL